MLINYKTKYFPFVTDLFNFFDMAVLNDLEHKADIAKTPGRHAGNSKLEMAA